MTSVTVAFLLGPSGPTRAAEGVVQSCGVVTTLNPYDIDWAGVAARAKADLGEEPVARFSDCLRKAMNVTADTFRQGAFYPRDTERLRFGQPPPSAYQSRRSGAPTTRVGR